MPLPFYYALKFPSNHIKAAHFSETYIVGTIFALLTEVCIN